MRSLNGRGGGLEGDEGLKESMVVLGNLEKSFGAKNGRKDELVRVHLRAFTGLSPSSHFFSTSV
jgi:hypothetical protein